ncbi:MAG TPA: sugar phosphate isomerase/epimerase [Bacteroidota bacterium]
MKVYLSTWSLRRLLLQKQLRIQDMPVLARALGFDGVEIEDIWFPSSHRGVARALNAESRRARTPILLAVSNDFSVSSERSLRAQIRHTVKFFRLAAQVGSTTVRVLLGSKDSARRKIPQIVRAFHEILPVARNLNLTLAIENHDALSRNPDILNSVLMKIDSKDVGVCLDFGNLNSNTRYAAIEKLAPKAMMVHAKAYHFKPDGTEHSIDYARCFSILRGNSFKGPVIAEYEGPGDQIIGSLKTLFLVRRFSS